MIRMLHPIHVTVISLSASLHHLLGSIPWEAALKPIASTHIHIPPSVGGDCLPENSTFKSPGCSYIVIIIYNNLRTSQSGLLRTLDGYSGWLLRTTPDGYSGWLRRSTPDGYAGHGGSHVPSPRASLALGKPPTRRPVSPVPVPSTSTIAGLGRDSRIYHGGGSSLCWSVACVLRPHKPN